MSKDAKTSLIEESLSVSEADPFQPVAGSESMEFSQPTAAGFESLVRKLVTLKEAQTSLPTAITATFCGFNLDDGPLVTGLPGLPGEIVLAQATVPLMRSQIGAKVLVSFEDGEARRPIVTGVFCHPGPAPVESDKQLLSVRSDVQRLVLTAEREIELRCGDASITLTRAGKVLIRGKYVLSCSSGYNRIKGAAVDIN